MKVSFFNEDNKEISRNVCDLKYMNIILQSDIIMLEGLHYSKDQVSSIVSPVKNGMLTEVYVDKVNIKLKPYKYEVESKDGKN